MTNIFRDVTYHIFNVISYLNRCCRSSNVKLREPDKNYILLLVVLHKILSNFVWLVWLSSDLPRTFDTLSRIVLLVSDIGEIHFLIVSCVVR